MKKTQRKRYGIYFILDGYILKEFLIALSAIMLLFTTLFIIGDLFHDLKNFLEDNASFNTIIQYFILRLPRSISYVLPISTLLACMYAMAKLGKNMEITAMRASGISLLRCAGGMYLITLCVAICSFFLNEKIVPYATEKAEYIKDSVKYPNRKLSTMNMLTYKSYDKKRSWIFKCFNIDGVQEDTIIKQYDKDGNILWELKAKEAIFNKNDGWSFNNVTLTKYSDSILTNGLQHIPHMVKPLSEIPETPQDIMYSTKVPDTLSSFSIIRILQQSENMSDASLAIYKTILFYRLAFPLSCFIAIFLGIPLAGKNERSGVMSSIIVAIGIIILYVLVSNVSKVLGMRNLVSPIIAGAGPTIIFILYGIYNLSGFSIGNIFRK